MARSNAHISLHITRSNPRGTVVIQKRNADGTFRSPEVRAPRTKSVGSTFHVANYSSGFPAIQRSKLQ